MFIDNETHYQNYFSKVMIFDDKPIPHTGLCVLYSEKYDT